MVPHGTRGSARTGASRRLAEALLAGADPPDLALWASHLATDVHLRLGNRQVRVGREASLPELSRLFAHVAAMGRGFREIWPQPDGETLVLELDLLTAHTEETVPAVLVIRVVAPGPLIRDMRLYCDPTPLGL